MVEYGYERMWNEPPPQEVRPMQLLSITSLTNKSPLIGVNDWLASILGPGKVTPVIPKSPPPRRAVLNGSKEATPEQDGTPSKHVHYKDSPVF